MVPSPIRRVVMIATLTTAFLGLMLLPKVSLGFLTNTHRLINELGAQGSSIVLDEFGTRVSLNDFLQFFINPIFPQGLDTQVNGKKIVDWIGEGGVAEDQYLGSETIGGLTRSPKHFHTPLKPWDQSGLSLSDGTPFESSVRWAQNPNQSPGDKASWKDARDVYHAALTSASQGGRDKKFADTFKILGQLMHLVGDLASTAHARNDSHIEGDGFESFMGTRSDLVTGFDEVDRSILQQPTGDAVATVPVARIWDTDTYNGSNPEITTGSNVGLAEFTSANFFSDDTISRTTSSDPILPFPAIDRLSPGPVQIYPPTGRPRQYLSKLGDGVAPITHMVAEGVFVRFTPPFIHRYVLDDLVYEDYARELLPRAIGYSAGVLGYFFRGIIFVEPPLVDTALPSNPPTTISLTNVANVTPDEETGSGTLSLVLLYLSQTNTDESFPQILVSNQVSGNVSRSPQNVTFPFSSLTFPATIGPLTGSFVSGSDVLYQGLLVYRGPLGRENDSVIVSRCAVSLGRFRAGGDPTEFVEVVGGEGC